MVACILGKYLKENGYLTEEQYAQTLNKQKETRVKLGLIAVSEGFMTVEQADKVNSLQMTTDKRFGDIAVEEGYLNEVQLDKILKKQGDQYLTFVQAMIDLGFMTITKMNMVLSRFQSDNSFSTSEVEDIKSGDTDKIVPVYMPADAEEFVEIAQIAMRTVIRCIDNEAYMDKAFLTDKLEVNNGAFQAIEGELEVSCGFFGKGDSLLPMAEVFARDEFPEMDEDAQDSIAEFTNCVNGLYVSAVSQRNIDTELMPPELVGGVSAIEGTKLCVVPMYIKEKLVYFVMTGKKSISRV